MPRQLRYKLPGVPQHEFAAHAGPSARGTCASMHIARGNNRQATFFDDGDYVRYLEDMQEAADKWKCDVHAYVLMTNHVHLLVTPQEEDSIAKVMQSVGRKYVRYINGSYKRSGTLWEGRYKSSVIQSERYLLTCYRYIELNPVRAGMVDSPADYRWSSYRHNAFGMDDGLITHHAEYESLGYTGSDRQYAYRELFRQQMDNALLHEIRDTTQQCRVLGNERFRNEIEQALAIKTTPGKRGRPRKVDVEF